MTLPPFSSPPTARSYARRAGVTLLVVGLLAVALAGIVGLFALVLPVAGDDPGVRQSLADLQQQLQIGPDALRLALFVQAGLGGLYAAAAVTLGIGLLASDRAGWRVAATVLCGLVLTLMALNVLASLMSGIAVALVGALLIALPHGLALLWLTQARVAPTAVPAVIVVPPYRPMQDYYLAPVPPPGRA